MSGPDERPEELLIAPQHDHPDGATQGWAATDFGPEHYVGDDDTDALDVVADGAQDDGPEQEGISGAE